MILLSHLSHHNRTSPQSAPSHTLPCHKALHHNPLTSPQPATPPPRHPANFDPVTKSASFEEMGRTNVELVFEILQKR